jgi:hypothetical protein
MQRQVTQLAQDAGITTSDIRCDEAESRPDIRQESEPKVLAFIVQHPPRLNVPHRSNGKTADFLVQLETENAELRNRAVELALQIQKLVESQLR